MIKILALFSVFCAYVADAQFSASGQQALVNAHNTLRSRIAKGTYTAKGARLGPASNMRKIVWDQGIAAKAQAYANTHPNGHSHTKLGENMYWGNSIKVLTNKDPEGMTAAKMWEDEFQKFGLASNIYNQKTMLWTANTIGHASQMAWADTYKMGCGVAGWQGSQWYQTVVVCQYDGPGNWDNKPVFKKGAQCSACPAGTRCESSTGLCA